VKCRAEGSVIGARGGLFIEDGAQTGAIKPQAKTIVLSKSCNFWFAPISVLRPDATEFFVVNGAVFCLLQLSRNLSQQFSHLALPQSVPSVTYNSEKHQVTGCMLEIETQRIDRLSRIEPFRSWGLELFHSG
jgi:carbonic anhydrase